MTSITDFAEPEVAARRTASPALEATLVGGEEWERIVAGFDEVCQEQLHTFAAHRWPATAREPMVFRRNGEIVGGALVLIQSLPLRLGAIAVSKWGPMLADAAAPDAEAIYAGMIEAMVAEYAEKRAMMLSVLPRASVTPSNARLEHLLARGFRPGSELVFPARYIVDLAAEPDGRRKGLDQKWRYHLNKSEKAGLSFEHADQGRLADFETLYSAMTGRKQFSDHSAYETLPVLLAMEPAELRPELFFVRHAGEPVAGAVIFTAGERAVYLYGATNEQALPLRAGYFMHWQIIGWLRANTRARWYDLGGTDGYRGLHQFKKGMVGAHGAIEPVPPVANYAANGLSYALGIGAFTLRDGVHAMKRRIAGWRNPKARPDLEPPPRTKR